jgi:hypothetical protein
MGNTGEFSLVETRNLIQQLYVKRVAGIVYGFSKCTTAKFEVFSAVKFQAF